MITFRGASEPALESHASPPPSSTRDVSAAPPSSRRATPTFPATCCRSVLCPSLTSRSASARLLAAALLTFARCSPCSVVLLHFDRLEEEAEEYCSAF
ncbi:hypothetical protein E2542_SST07299 [Spatholobus suberectus]|nr:hypothetical protein E2542_SST07299 [Spatholobus suberectus]